MKLNMAVALIDIIGEYIHKVNCCDECVCEMYCIENRLKYSRVPQGGCETKILHYLAEKHPHIDNN